MPQTREEREEGDKRKRKKESGEMREGINCTRERGKEMAERRKRIKRETRDGW